MFLTGLFVFIVFRPLFQFPNASRQNTDVEGALSSEGFGRLPGKKTDFSWSIAAKYELFRVRQNYFPLFLRLTGF
ncbi:hypothetical protein ACMYZ5_01775 [Bacteroides sp. KG68]|uniref:hypothetical protein n=1 Tax=unclassified Bacteroides TaxID=2646097 RepID=UPI003D985C89